jgi:hypothetical protein
MTEDPSWRDTFYNVPFETPFDLLTSYLMNRQTVLKMSEGSPLNTDINAYAEVRQSSVFYSSDSQMETVQPLLSEHFDGDYASILPEYDPTDMDFMENLIYSMGRQKKYEKYLALLKKFEKAAAGDPKRHESLAQICYDVERMACAKKYGKLSLDRRPTAKNLNFLISVHDEMRDYTEVIELYRTHRKDAGRPAECMATNAYLQNDMIEDAAKLIEKIEKNYDDYLTDCDTGLMRLLGNYHLKTGDLKKASVYLDGFVDLFPNDLPGLALIIRANLANHKWTSANADAVYFGDNLYYEIDRLETLAKHYRNMKWHKDAEFLEEKLRRLKK